MHTGPMSLTSDIPRRHRKLLQFNDLSFSKRYENHWQCMCVCTYVYTFEYIHKYTYVGCIHAYTYIWLYSYRNVRMNMCMHVCMRTLEFESEIPKWIHTHMHVHMYDRWIQFPKACVVVIISWYCIMYNSPFNVYLCLFVSTYIY